MAKKDGRIRSNRVMALLLAFVMITGSCAVSVHAAGDTASFSGAGPAVSGSAEEAPASSAAQDAGTSPSGGESGSPQSAPESSAPSSSGEEISSAAPSSAQEASSAPDASSDAASALKQQTLAAVLYTDETLSKQSADGASVTVAGELPEGAAVTAYPVKVKIGGAPVLAAYDITICNEDGSVYQPDDSVTVTIRAPKLKGAGSVDVYHVVEDETAQDGESRAARSSAEQGEESSGSGQAVVEQDGGTRVMKAAKVAGGVKTQSEAVEFSADSFSIYALAEEDGQDGAVDIAATKEKTIKSGDTVTLYDGNTDSGTWSVDDNSIVDLIQSKNYDYGIYATVKGRKAGTATITCQYGWWVWTKTDTITIRVTAAGTLHQVDTVDSWSQGVQLSMFNYDAKASWPSQFSILNGSPSGGLDNREGYGSGNTEGTTKQGLLKLVVESDGFPKTVTDRSMSGWFTSGSTRVDSSQSANHLFLKSVYDRTGYFHYSSAENFAAFNGAEDSSGVKSFTLYQELGTPEDSDGPLYGRGNFLPYNTIDSLAKSSHTNRYDLNGKALSKSDPGYDAPLYLPDGGKADFHFGMYLKADFVQPKDGRVTAPKSTTEEDMVFKFVGDDDMWIYLDGVLVLDLGGIHVAQGGTINFNTGAVTWTNNTSSASRDGAPTSIKEMLDAAVGSGKPDSDGNITYTVKKFNEDGTAANRSIVLKKTAAGKYIFADYSKHTIQMFYMERGAGASDLAIDFNLPTVPKNSVQVAKEVKNLNSFWADQTDYKMKLYVEDASGSNTYSARSGAYTVGGQSYTTAADGTFSLKNGQTAVFSEIPANSRYYVEEQKPDDGISYKAQFNAGTEQAFPEGSGSVKSTYFSAEDTPSVQVTNTAQNTGGLTVTKKLVGFPAGQTFAANFSLWKTKTGSESADTPIGTVPYSEFTDPDGGGDKTYTFSGLLPGTYYVAETDPSGADGCLLKTTYSVGGAEQETGSAAAVTLTGKNSGAVRVTNTYAGYTLPVTGGAGTLPFRIAGAAILIGAASGLGFYFWKGRKRKGGPPPG